MMSCVSEPREYKTAPDMEIAAAGIGIAAAVATYVGLMLLVFYGSPIHSAFENSETEAEASGWIVVAILAAGVASLATAWKVGMAAFGWASSADLLPAAGVAGATVSFVTFAAMAVGILVLVAAAIFFYLFFLAALSLIGVLAIWSARD